MKVVVLDVETTVQWIQTVDEDNGKTKTVIDNSPYNPKNRLVSVNWRKIENGIIGDDNSSIFFHNDQPVSDSPKALQDALDWADLVVAHNAKYDIMWLKESGFRLPDKFYCTMIGEYILSRASFTPLSLKETAIRRNVTHKKSDLTQEYWDSGIGFERMPIPVILEYADADVLSCAEIFLQQQKDWLEEENLTLVNIVDLMNEMLDFIVEIEHNGIFIDTDKLEEVGAAFQKERDEIELTLNKIARDVMGDTPISLTSGIDVSKLVYSREVINPKLHKEIFKIGADANGNPQHPPYMTPNQFAIAVKKTTRVIRKTTASHCELCNGTGKIRKFTKKGEPFKILNKCPRCDALGYILTDTNQIAGLKLIPEAPMDASVHGFAAAKDQIDRLIAQAQQRNNLIAIEFLTKKKRLNAINTYLNSFVEGMKRWTRSDNLLHAGFNQTTTKTGRLSSSNPNFQNQPKDNKFPIRKCVISRFENGQIMECDFSGLEFVVAGELSRDPQIIEDILNRKDVHRQTACIVHKLKAEEQDWSSKLMKELRNSVKPHTFAPLYGAQGASLPEHIKTYYEEFFNIYKRHGEWQLEQMDNVMRYGFIRTPSGREYTFPGTKRIRGGRTTNATKIVNYPVQGFATGDIVPLACIRALREFRRLGLKSRLILTVHDSIVVDCHPDEIRQVYDILVWATTGVVDEIKERWGYTMVLPLRSEVSAGPNWGEMEAVHF